MTRITLELVPHRAAVLADHDSHVDVLVRIVAPEQPPATQKERAPINLALVIDRSGSMSGRPLEEAKRCVGMIVDRLGPKDRASLVVYDNEVDVLVPSQTVRDRAVFHAAIQNVASRGMTALRAGWAKGAEQAALGLDRGRILSRVLLLSDGQANQGCQSDWNFDPGPNCNIDPGFDRLGLASAKLASQLLAARLLTRADAVKVGRQDGLDAGAGVSRPRLDGGEHDGSLGAGVGAAAISFGS